VETFVLAVVLKDAEVVVPVLVPSVVDVMDDSTTR
jgi:hypothetical protein